MGGVGRIPQPRPTWQAPPSPAGLLCAWYGWSRPRPAWGGLEEVCTPWGGRVPAREPGPHPARPSQPPGWLGEPGGTSPGTQGRAPLLPPVATHPDCGRRGTPDPSPSQPPHPGATGWPCPLPEKSVYLLRKELREAGSSLLGGRMGWGSGDMGPRGPPLSQASSWQGHTFCGTVRGHQSLHHWLVSYWERRGGDIIRAWRRGQGPGPDPGHGRDGRRVCTF